MLAGWWCSEKTSTRQQTLKEEKNKEEKQKER